MTHQHHTSSARTRRRPAPARRGVTLLEVILAVVLLALTVTAVMGAISAILGMESEGRRRLEAFEVANRIMLQYLDDEDGLPPKTLPITYGDNKYFWSLDKTPARMVINRKQESNGANLMALDRYLLIDVSVYQADQSGMHEVKGEEYAAISRIIDPTNARNPDSIDTFSTNTDKIATLVKYATGTGPQNTGGARRSGKQLK